MVRWSAGDCMVLPLAVAERESSVQCQVCGERRVFRRQVFCREGPVGPDRSLASMGAAG